MEYGRDATIKENVTIAMTAYFAYATMLDVMSAARYKVVNNDAAQDNQRCKKRF